MSRLRNPGDQLGGLYVEALIAVVLLAVALIPALDALRTGLLASTIQETNTAVHYRLSSRMAEVLAEPFFALDAQAQAVANPATPTVYSDSPGTPLRRLVFLSRYDGDNVDDSNPFTGTDEGLLWIRVAIEGTQHASETLRAW